MAVNAFRLGPFSALSGALEDDRSNESHPLKGGFNYRVMGGEVWPRHTLDVLGGTEGLRVPFTHTILVPSSYPKQLLIGPMACLKIADFATNFQVLLSPTYDPTSSCSITLQEGSTAITIGAGTPPASGQWFIVNNVKPASYSEYYSFSPTGAGLILTRPYTGTTVTFTADLYDPIIPVASGLFNFGTNDTPRALMHCDATVFRQAVDHVADDMWTGSPALIGGAQYIIYTSSFYGPTAISIDLEEPIKRDIFRDTSVTPAEANAINPSYCETFKQRLFYGYVAPPDSSDAPEQTFWWSEIGDILQWHRVVLGVDFPNFRTNFAFTGLIQGIKTLGDRLIIHYTDRQEMVSSTGSNAEPFVIEENNQQIGVVAPRSIVPVGRLHYFWSQVGPASFDGTDVSPLGGEMADTLARFAGGTTLPWDSPQLVQQGVKEVSPSAIVSWKNEARQEVYYLAGVEREQNYTSTEKNASIYAYNWDKEEWSTDVLEIQNLSHCGTADYILLPVWGGGSGGLGVGETGYSATQFIFLANGSVLFERPELQYALEPARYIPKFWIVGPIFDDMVTYTLRPHVMEMQVETGWQDFDSPFQKDLLLMEIDVRDTRLHGWNSIRPRRGWNYLDLADSVALGYMLIDIYTDYNMAAPAVSLEIAVDHSAWPRTKAIRLSERGIGTSTKYAPMEEGHNGPGRQTIRKKLRVQGQVFKFVFSNPDPPTGDHNKMLFILSQVTCWFVTNEGHIRRMLADEGA